MTLVLLIAGLWLAGIVVLLAVCQAAARGDRVAARAALDTHERPLAA